MLNSLNDFDTFIHDEMMIHPALFIHSKAKRVALINCQSEGMILEIIKHLQLSEIWLVNSKVTNANIDSRIKTYNGENQDWMAGNGLFDVVIATSKSFSKTDFQAHQRILAQQGIFICLSHSLFEIEKLKATYQVMQKVGFEDLQIMHFPQPGFPSGARAAFIATNKGALRRAREKDIFNKTFSTRYYNYDVHNAALVMPEFMRLELNAEK